MDQNPQKESRPPINLRIKFRSESIEQFIERYAVDVSRGGIFIRTREPLAVGTQLKLDFQFQNGSPLMAGDGTVVWIREVDPNRTNVPPGMGVRFDKLTPESQTVLEQLLVEKTKRDRGGVPGSGSASGGGMAVRRPSSMFSVLDPQGAAAASQPTAEASAPIPPAGQQPPPSGPLAAVTSQLSPGLKSPVASASADNGEGPQSNVYRPIGATRNPFSAGTAVPSSRPAEDSAPFDDINDEPTQIAGKLPSFMSDEEATVVAGDAFGLSPKATGARAPLPGIGKIERPAVGKAGGDLSPPSAGELVGWKDALDELLPSGPPSPAMPVSGAKETAAPTTGFAAKDKKDKVAAKAPPPASAATAEPPKFPAVAPSVPASGPSTVSATTSNASQAKSADAKFPVVATAAPGATATATAARVAGNGRRSPAALIGASVVVLAAVTIFLFRFFASQSTETAPTVPTPGSSTTSAALSAPAEAPGVTKPAPAVPVAADNEPARGPDSGSLGAATPPTGSTSTTASPGTMPSTSPPEPSIRKVTGKHRASRGGADSNPESTAASATPRATEPASTGDTAARATAPSGGTAVPSEIKAETPSPAPGDSDAVAYQVRVTSKPDGADVMLDGQTVGKTPFAAGIADIAAPHFIAVRKDGFETFEQMISSSSAWIKTKAVKGRAAPQVLKINAKLKSIAGGGAEARPSTEPPAPTPGTDSAPKAEIVKPDRPMAPADERTPAESVPK